MTFHVGQKVVCVDARREFRKRWFAGPLVQGRVYTFSALGMCRDDAPGILVEELMQMPGLMFRATRFRPIRTTDISIFTSMLAPIPEKELA